MVDGRHTMLREWDEQGGWRLEKMCLVQEKMDYPDGQRKSGRGDVEGTCAVASFPWTSPP